MTFSTLPAGPDVELSYIDSGEPTSVSSYTTIVAIHGMCFSNLIFQKLFPVAQSKGARIVAPNRRHYPGSTAYTTEELGFVLGGGDEAKKDGELQARGLEIATFIDNFIIRNKLPPISADGKSGGIVLLGWSLGSATALASISSAHALPVDARARLGAYIRSVIAYDPAPIVLGLPTPAQNWTPLLDTYVPEALRLAVFGQWATSYFDHGDLTKRDIDALSWVVPSPNHVPTLFKMSDADRAEMQRYGGDGFSDLPYMIHFMSQFKASYRKAVYDPETVKIFPALKPIVLFGQKSGAFAIVGMWAVEDDQKEAHGEASALKIKLIPDINHFWHWDDPEKAFEEFIACSE